MEAEPERQLADPPATWQEHWFDHRQLLRLYHSDEHCAIYVDPDVRRAEVRWLPRFINVTWQYSKATYGDAFGSDPRIYSIHHAGRHGGGHAGYYVSPVHDYHNVSDCGLDTWREGNALARELPAHEIGHSVESANNGVHGSPAYEIWGDSKWAEFYIYDLYTALGMDREAKGVYRRFTGNTDDFPRRGTRWFRDWFYPLWRDCGRAEVMNRFFRELARHFPRDSGGTYPGRDELGRVRPLHQRCCGRRHERPGRPRFRLAPRVGRPTGARPRAVPRHHVLKYRAVLPGRGQSRDVSRVPGFVRAADGRLWEIDRVRCLCGNGRLGRWARAGPGTRGARRGWVTPSRSGGACHAALAQQFAQCHEQVQVEIGQVSDGTRHGATI